MTERLTVTPLEASVTLTNEIFGRSHQGHYNQEVAKALHGTQWKRWYHPENNPYRPEDFLKDSQHSVLFINAVDQALETLHHNEQATLRLRFGLEDGKLRIRTEIAQKYGVTESRIGQIETKALRKLRHPSRSGLLKPLLPERP
ncbi:hypothetical protein HYT74_04335 [Candidatus Daviesbacteria bacterium]|nr:hypothetical protein [Candidatus Daviesbacteria bacterium]